MAVVVNRSMNAELLEGSCDGTYKRLVPDRSTHPDADREKSARDREEHLRWPYGFFEAPEMETPDGRFVHPVR